jgi:hypothetical protein
MQVCAPHTHELLAALIEQMDGPPGWKFSFVRTGGAPFFMIKVPSRDNYDYSRKLTTLHEHSVPWAEFNEKTWKRWLFDKCLASMIHEMGEMVRWGDVRPFAPTHGPGECPYTLREYRDPMDALTTQNGHVRAGHGSQKTVARENLQTEAVDKLRCEMWGYKTGG